MDGWKTSLSFWGAAYFDRDHVSYFLLADASLNKPTYISHMASFNFRSDAFFTTIVPWWFLWSSTVIGDIILRKQLHLELTSLNVVSLEMKKDSKCFWEILHGVWLQSKKTYHMHFFGISHLAISRKTIAVESIHSHEFYRPTLPTKVRGPRDKEDEEEETQQCQYLSSPWITDKANGFAPKTCPAKKWFKYQAQSIWSLENSLLTIYCSSPRYNTASVSRCFKTEGNVCETSTFCLLKYSHDNRHEDVCWPKAKLMQDLDNQDIRKSDQCADHQAVSLISTWKMVILGNITGRYFIILLYCQPWS